MEPIQVAEVRSKGWSYRAEMYPIYKPSYVGAAPLTKYFVFNREWKEVPYNALPATAYQALRRALRADMAKGPMRDPAPYKPIKIWFGRGHNDEVDSVWHNEDETIAIAGPSLHNPPRFVIFTRPSKGMQFLSVGHAASLAAAIRRIASKRGKRERDPQRKIVASSQERYRASAAERRMYGGSTVTKFFIFYKDDKDDPNKWLMVTGYGPTPGERKTDAIRRAVASGLLGTVNPAGGVKRIGSAY